LDSVNQEANDCYLRHTEGTLTTTETRWLLPTLETVRASLRYALAALPEARNEQLARTVETLRRSTTDLERLALHGND
jgi:hypothetical protein